MLENIGANIVGNLATNALPGDEETESPHELLVSIHRLLEKLVSVTLAANQPKRDFVDIPVTLPIGISDFNIDARTQGFSQVAIYSPVAANIILRRPGPFDIALALPAGRFVTVQQPAGTLLVNSTSAAIPIVARYSDTIFGSVLP